MTERDKGQAYILRLLDELAAKQGLKLERATWWTGARPSAYYVLKVSTPTGKTAHQYFSPNEIGSCGTDANLRETVTVKVKNIVFRLTSADDIDIKI
jgi:hypothetical protein